MRSEPPQDIGKRRPLRLHVSTWIVIGFLTVSLALANSFGRQFEGWSNTVHCRHGWPWIYLARWTTTPPISPWPVARDVTYSSWTAAVADAVAGVLLVVLAASLWEAVQRWSARWRPIHRSSHIVLCVATTICLFLNIAGERQNEGNLSLGECEHGWPWTFLMRQKLVNVGAQRVNIWTPWEDAVEFNFPHWAGNAACSLAIVLAVTLLWEWRRRIRGSRWLQLNLREAMVLVFVCAALFGSTSLRRQWNRQQQQNVARLAESKLLTYVEPSGPDWLRDLVGDESMQMFSGAGELLGLHTNYGFAPTDTDWSLPLDFRHLRFLSLTSSAVGDTELLHIKGLTRLRHLDLTETQVTGAGVRHLQKLKDLRSLYLSETRVNDAGLQHLRGLTKLQDLRLDNTAITDVGTEHLTGLTELQLLGLNGTAIGDATLTNVKNLSNLEKLRVCGTQVSDLGLLQLRGLEKLCMLELARTRVTDDGLAHLRGHRHLWYLNLSQTEISDAGLRQLNGSTNLRMVLLRDCPLVSDSGVRQLQQSVPGLQVVR